MLLDTTAEWTSLAYFFTFEYYSTWLHSFNIKTGSNQLKFYRVDLLYYVRAPIHQTPHQDIYKIHHLSIYGRDSKEHAHTFELRENEN